MDFANKLSNLFQQNSSLFEKTQSFTMDSTIEPSSLDPTPKFGGSSSAVVIDRAIREVESALTRFAIDSNRESTMDTAFGGNWNRDIANSLFKDWAIRNFSNLPSIEIRLGSELNNANGAFSGDTQTIYLSSDFLTQTAGNIDRLTGVLLEEIGHAIDFRINRYDAAGDEGDIFSRLVRGEQISAADLLSLKTENDHALITLGGSAIAIEMSQIQMAEVGGKLYQIHRGTDNGLYLASSDNGTDWTGWQKIAGETPNAPVITNYKGTLYLAHRGLDNRIYFASYTDAQAGRWQALSGETPDGNAKTLDAPAMVEYRGKLYVAHRGGDNSMYLASTDGATWSNWRKLDGATPDAIGMTVFKDKLYLSHRGMGDQIFNAWLEGDTFSGWREQIGATPDAVSLAEFNGNLYQVHRGLSNKLYIRSSTDGESWGDWKEQGGETPSSPFIKAFQGKLYETHQGMSDQIFFASIDSGSGFARWKERGGLTPIDGDRLTQLAQKSSNLSGDEIREYRQLVNQRPENERNRWYRVLQDKTDYFNQRNNDTPGVSGNVMCNVTALANCLTYLGIKNRTPSIPQFEDALEQYRRNKGYGSRESWEVLAQIAEDFRAKPIRSSEKAGTTKGSYDEGMIKSALDKGSAVILSVRIGGLDHIVRVQGYDDAGFIVDDPYGKARLNGSRSYYEKLNSKFSDSATEAGSNNKWTWVETKAYTKGKGWFLVMEQGAI